MVATPESMACSMLIPLDMFEWFHGDPGFDGVKLADGYSHCSCWGLLRMQPGTWYTY